MGTEYVRADQANKIANGNVIDADDLDGEFNAIEAAFNGSTGHTHDGTSGEGAPIEVLGPAQDIVATIALLRPKTTNVIDLGTDTIRYKDFYLEGNADIDGTLNIEGATTLQSTLAAGNTSITGDLTVSGNAVISGNLTFGDAITDTITLTADVSSNIIPSAPDTYDLGDLNNKWKDIFIDGTGYIDALSSTSGTITDLTISNDLTVTNDLTVSGTLTATVTGNTTTADYLSTARTITLSGDVSGSVNFDGQTDVTITTTVADDSHNHTIANVDNLQSTLDAKSPLADPTFTGTLTAPTINASTALQIGGAAITASVTEINRLANVSSNVQTQLDGKVGSTFTGDVDITGELIVDSYNETFATITSSSGTATIDCEAGNVFSLTLSENITTFNWNNPPSSGTAYGFSLKVIQDSGGNSYTISWPTSIDWPSGTAPTLSVAANAIDQLVFYTHDGGTTWYGFIAGQALG